MSQGFEAFYRQRLKELELLEVPVGIHTYIRYQPPPVFWFRRKERIVARVFGKPQDTPEGLVGKFSVEPRSNTRIWDLIDEIKNRFGKDVVDVRYNHKIGAVPG